MPAGTLAVFDRALADLEAAGARIVPFEPAVTRHSVVDAFADAAKARGDHAPDPKAPAPTANALLRYFGRQGRDAPKAVERGLAAYRSFYDVLPEDPAVMLRLANQPCEVDPAGVSFARSREEAVSRLAASMKAHGVEAMVYPTMPFPAPDAVDPWPDIRTPLGFGNWTGLPEVSVPAGLGADGMPAGNLSFVGLPGSDARMLTLAYAYEQVSRRFVPPPPPE